MTDRGDLLTRTIIIAGGHGAFEPKKLPGYDMDPWEGRGAHYLVGEKAAFAGKNVIIVGGGDSALDWTLNLLDTADGITLVHRREGFRAHEVTVERGEQAAESGKVELRVPFQVKDVEGNGAIENVTLFHSEDDGARGRAAESTRSCSSSASRPRSGPLKDVAPGDREGRDQGRPRDEDEPRGRLGGRRHHDLRGQAQADRDRVRRGGRSPSRRPSTTSGPR